MHLGLRRTAGAVVAALLLAGAGAAQDGAGPGKRIQEIFRGEVVSVKGRRVEIAYDFSEPAQIEDWKRAYPFVAPSSSGEFRIDGKALRASGNAGLRHGAVWDGDVRLVATLSCEDCQDFGGFVLDEDRAPFDLYAAADTVFALLDRKNPRRHMLATFFPSSEGPGGDVVWREVQTSYEPRVGTDVLDLSIRKKGPLNEFRIGSGRLFGADREARIGPRIAVGLYCLGSKVQVRRARVSGVLDAAWLRKMGAAFEDVVPEDPDPIPVEKEAKDPPPTAPPPGPEAKGPPPGPAEWEPLAAKVLGPEVPKSEREAAADALVEIKERRCLRRMIDAMYGEDPVGRELGNRVFRQVSGKETGFRPDLPRDVRNRMMPHVWEIWYAVKDQIDREEAKKAKEK